MESDIVVIRDYNPKIDNGYIYSTWTKYAWYSPKETIKVEKKVFFKDLCMQIENCLRGGVVRVACLKDDPDTILGYIVVFQGEQRKICIKKEFLQPEIFDLLAKSVRRYLWEK